MPRSIIVTGASRGIGQAIAIAFLAAGDSVVLIGRDAAKLKDALQGCNIGTGTPHFVEADVSTVEGCEGCFRDSIEALGSTLDVLVNNAGAGLLKCSLESCSLKDWDFHMNVNMRSAFLLSQLAVPYLEKTKGCILNISSIAAQRPFPGFLPYCIAKSGVDMLTKCSALELAAKGIRVNAINPSTVVTGFHEQAGLSKEVAAEFYKDSDNVHPIGRVGTPSDIAELSLFLCDGSKSGWLTGQTIVADGGRLLPVLAKK